MNPNFDINRFVSSTLRKYLMENSTNDITLYHGTSNQFNSFDLKFFNSGSGDGGWLGHGIYLTNDYEYAESYGDVLECKVNLNNPYVLTDYLYSSRPLKLANELGVSNAGGVSNKLTQMGYDGVILKYKDDEKTWLGDFIELCVFNTSNITILNRYEQGDDSPEINTLRGY